MGQIAVRVENLTHGYAGRTLFKNASLTIDKGERVAIIGPNGAGGWGGVGWGGEWWCQGKAMGPGRGWSVAVAAERASTVGQWLGSSRRLALELLHAEMGGECGGSRALDGPLAPTATAALLLPTLSLLLACCPCLQAKARCCA